MSQKHEIKLNMSLAGTRLYGCAELAKKLRHSTGSKIELLLPIDGSWLPNGEISYESGNSHCALLVPVIRNFKVFFVKNIVVIVVIVQAAMLSLWLNPLVPPLMGGRFAISITAMLTISNVVNVDLSDELGVLPKYQLLWLDWFYIFHFGAVLTCIAESAFVHVLIRNGKDALATGIDKEFRIILPFVMYPLCVIGLLLWAGIPSPEVGETLIALAIIVPLAGGALRAMKVNRRYEARKQQLAYKIIALPEEELDDDAPLLLETFTLFDFDRSGDINEKEVRSLLTIMYPSMPARHRKELMDMAQERINFEVFDDLIVKWRHYVRKNDPTGTWAAAAPSSSPTETKPTIKGESSNSSLTL